MTPPDLLLRPRERNVKIWVEGERLRFIAEAMRDPGATYRADIAGRERVGQTYRWENTAATPLGTITGEQTESHEPRLATNFSGRGAP